MPTLIAQGTNGHNSQESFFWRRYYDAFVAPMITDEAIPIDFRNERPLYGRVNGNGDPIYVIKKEDFFRDLPNGKNGQTKLINFVADAFEDLQEEMGLSIAKGRLSTNGVYVNIKPRFGIMDVQTFYNDYLDILYRRFTSKYLEAEWAKAKEVKTFEGYMKVFLYWIRRESARLPFTRTAFLSGNMVPPSISGLCVQTHDVDFSEDFNKHAIFVEDRNFEAYRILARKFGFMLDRHAPWRLVADVTSPYMGKKMFKYGLTSETLFKKYYTPSYVFDIDVMRVVLYNWYNQ